MVYLLEEKLSLFSLSGRENRKADSCDNILSVAHTLQIAKCNAQDQLF
jgi:hypothetical protein